MEWAQIRICTGYYTYLTEMARELRKRDRRISAKAEENNGLNRKIQLYQRKRDRVRGNEAATERLAKYERKVEKYTELRRLNLAFIDDQDAKFGKLKLNKIVQKRKTAKRDLKKNLTKFKVLKWVTIMNYSDLVAINMRRALNLSDDKPLRFTVGSSVTEGLLTYLRMVAEDLEIGPLDSKNLFELTGRKIKLLPQTEASKHGFKGVAVSGSEEVQMN